MVGSLVNNKLEWILKERIVDQFTVNTWRDQERQTSQDSQSQGKTGGQDSGIWNKSAVDSTVPLVRAFHGQTIIMIRMEKKDERVQGKDKRQCRSLAPIKVGPPWCYYSWHESTSVLDMASCRIFPLNSERTGMYDIAKINASIQ